MSAHFQELDWRPTPMGAISLRRRRDLSLGVDVYEIKLDDDFLMSSLFTEGEVALARLALAALPEVDDQPEGGLDVLVGGLGLGYTAHAVLEDPRVRSLTVVDALAEVIEWHERGLLPLSAALTSDPRCRLVHGDFFTMASTLTPDSTRSEPGDDGRLGPDAFHAIIVDIDHSPAHVLHPAHAEFYRLPSLRRLAGGLPPGGVFALWSNDPPDEAFTSVLAGAFAHTETHVVHFPTLFQGGTAANTVYVATT